MKRIVCLALVLVLVAGLFSGCGEQKKLLGTWECTVDLSAFVRQLLVSEALGGDLEISDFSVTARLSFEKDNTFRLELDQQKLADAFDRLLVELEEGLVDLLEEQLRVQGLGVPIEELLALSGLELSDLTEELHQSFETDSLLAELSGQAALEGYYRVKGDKLLLTGDEEAKLADVYILYTAEETALTLSAHVGENTFLRDNLILGTAPVEFTRVQ